MHKLVFPFVITIFLFISCKKESVVIDEQSNADFEKLWNTTDLYYPFFEFKGIDWDHIYTNYQPEFIECSEERKIELLGNLLNELKDGHANLFDANENYISFYKPPRSLKDQDAFSHDVVAGYLSSELKTLDVFRYEIIAGNYGYMHISSFPSDQSRYRQFDTVLDYLKNTEGLIIDIRHNGGGSTNASDYFISRLIDEELEGVIWTARGGGNRPLMYHQPAGEYQYTKRTALLINGKSFSTSEAMANLCKKIDHIKLIGDTTGGGGGVPDEIFNLPSGLKFRVPTRCQMRYDGEHIEWNGIPPDILVPQTKEDIDNKKDKQLEAAIAFVSEE